MAFRLHHSSMLAMAVFCCSFAWIGGKDTGNQLACYHGKIEVDNKGQVPLNSEKQLTLLPCAQPVTPSSTTISPVLPGTTIMPTVSGDTPKATTSSKPSTTADTTTSVPPAPSTGASRRRRDSPTPWVCAVNRTFPDGPKLSLNTTWTADFSCLPQGDCSKDMFCCTNSKCNSLPDFMHRGGIKYTSVTTCLVGSKNSNGTNVRVWKCQGNSHFCYNSTKNGLTKFGCSMESTCSNITSQEASHCTKTGSSTSLCCCGTDNCNGPLPIQPTFPYHIVTTAATPYLVTASRTSSHWTLVLLIAAGVLIGALVGVVIVVLCKRWKRKRINGPLNISYSRVSADFTVEDDDNIFSY